MNVFRLFSCAVLLALAPSALNAQSGGRSRLALNAGPDFSFLANFHGHTRQEQDGPPGYRARLDFERALGRRWAWRIGVGYARQRYGFTQQTSSFLLESEINGMGPDPVVVGNLGGTASFRIHDEVLTAPFGVRYQWSPHFYADTEASANLVLNDITGNLIFVPGFGLNFGCEVPVGPSTRLFAQPAARFLLNTRLPRDLRRYRQHPYSFALEVGVRQGIGRR